MECEKCGVQTCIIYVTASEGKICGGCRDLQREGTWKAIQERNRRWLDGTQEEVDDERN